MVVAKNYSIARCSWISFRGSVKVELDEVDWGGGPKGGAAGKGGRRRRGKWVMRWERFPVLKDQEF
jgi:hypothetical protein